MNVGLWFCSLLLLGFLKCWYGEWGAVFLLWQGSWWFWDKGLLVLGRCRKWWLLHGKKEKWGDFFGLHFCCIAGVWGLCLLLGLIDKTSIEVWKWRIFFHKKKYIISSKKRRSFAWESKLHIALKLSSVSEEGTGLTALTNLKAEASWQTKYFFIYY